MSHDVTKESEMNHRKKTVENNIYHIKKSITSFYPKLFSTFKSVFHIQPSSTRMIQYSQRQAFKLYFHIALETMKNVMKSGAVENVMQIISPNNCSIEEIYVGRN